MEFLANLMETYGGVSLEPDIDGSGPPQEEPEEVIPIFYRPFYYATDAVALGEMSLEEWMAIWEQVRLTLQRTAEQVDCQMQDLDPDLGPEAHLVGELLLQGLQEALVALQMMLPYMHSGDAKHLNQGWAHLMEASHAIAAASQAFALIRQQRQRQRQEDGET